MAPGALSPATGAARGWENFPMTTRVHRSRPFVQVNVFSATAYAGNPLAVVLDATGLTDRQMANFANWTNLSETTFLLPPTDSAADYKVRIFTASGELPFAGHPTLGSAHAWLDAGGTPRGTSIVQECGVGLVDVRLDGARLAFAAPTPMRRGPLEPALVELVASALRIPPADIVDHQWVDNGPGWLAVLLGSAEAVLEVEPDPAAIGDLKVGLVGPRQPQAQPAFEVRALFGVNGSMVEDPVTGSLNASVAQWLIETGRAPASYVAGQGARLGRDGRIFIDCIDGQVWVGGHVTTCIAGTVDL